MLPEGGFAAEAGGGADFFLEWEGLVLLRSAVGARSRAGLDLAGRGGDRQVSDKRVFGFAGTMRNDRVVAGLASEFDGINGFGDRANLIELDENRVGKAFVDAARESLRIGHKEIVADELDFSLRRFRPDRFGQRFPAGPVILGHTVLERDDGIFFNPLGPISGQLLGRVRGPVGLLEDVFAAGFVEEFARSRINSNVHLLAGLVTSGHDSPENDLNVLSGGLP